MAFSLTWLSDILKQAGLKVAEQPGWETRGRGDVGTIKGVMCHYTAGPLKGIMPSLGIITEGRPDLLGPLAQLGLGRDGTFFIVAAGRANHAGAGNWQGITTGNSSFIGIEAENTGESSGPRADPWPAVQMDAYRRGVAAILRKIGANAIMCCGHREYALPPGRKSDPNFDMNEFRTQVAAIMAGTAPAASIIPAVDAAGRATLRRGDRNESVKTVQALIKVDQDGIFGPITEAALREFQRANGLVPDGIVGPRTWAALLAPPKLGPTSATAKLIDQITQLAGSSAIANYQWKNRGKSPSAYLKGMAVVYGRVYSKFKKGDQAALEMTKAVTDDPDRDALAWYADEFEELQMDNSVAGVATLRHLFVLLIGLGMRESSGKYCEGRDTTANNVSAETAEAGLFQMSYNARLAHPLLPIIFREYSTQPDGFLDIFKQGVFCSAASAENFGTGDGQAFQALCKGCPAFAAEFAAVGLRNIRKHWGPITRKEAEIRPECETMLTQVEALVDAAQVNGPVAI